MKKLEYNEIELKEGQRRYQFPINTQFSGKNVAFIQVPNNFVGRFGDITTNISLSDFFITLVSAENITLLENVPLSVLSTENRLKIMLDSVLDLTQCYITTAATVVSNTVLPFIISYEELEQSTQIYKNAYAVETTISAGERVSLFNQVGELFNNHKLLAIEVLDDATFFITIQELEGTSGIESIPSTFFKIKDNINSINKYVIDYNIAYNASYINNPSNREITAKIIYYYE